jgi:sterol desaturase/sphingolipid hydroxylase (fatty acid hydroxylase superfamily)
MDLANWDWILRLLLFIAVLLAMLRWEKRAPRRQLGADKPLRWGSNLVLVFCNSLLLRVLLPLGAVGAALYAQSRGLGLFNSNRLPIPGLLAGLLSILALDFVIYLQHLLFHAAPFLWRFHMVHHADRDIDVTTGLRFHTVEILISMGIKLGAIVLLGAPAWSVLFFECLLMATSLYNHGNVRLAPRWDRILRLVIVTPDMHRVHHSVEVAEATSNFGFNLPWWDYLLGTYRAQPAKGHEGMSIGLKQFTDERAEQLHWMLALPFVGSPGDYSFNHWHAATTEPPTSTAEPRLEDGQKPAPVPQLPAPTAPAAEETRIAPVTQVDTAGVVAEAPPPPPGPPSPAREETNGQDHPVTAEKPVSVG